MASLNQAVKLNIMELSRDVTITVKLSRMREWTLRVKIAALVFRLACWILPFEAEIITDDN